MEMIEAILGPNGAGETTLFRILTGLIPPLLGPGEGKWPLDSRRHPSASLYSWILTATVWVVWLPKREFLDYIGVLRGINDVKTRRSEVQRVLEYVNMTKFATNKLGKMSGGMRQGIAQAIMGDPQFLGPMLFLGGCAFLLIATLRSPFAALSICMGIWAAILFLVQYLPDQILLFLAGMKAQSPFSVANRALFQLLGSCFTLGGLWLSSKSKNFF